MKSSSRIAVATAVFLLAGSTARAAGVDFKDPRRALGRQDDIKVDAQMLQETISSGSPISVTYQIENLTPAPIAIADKVADASFDPDSLTITVSIGAEIPQGTTMPHLITIAPGQTRRQALAQDITGDIQFSRAIVNYIWEKFMVQAFVSPSNTFDLARLDPKNDGCSP